MGVLNKKYWQVPDGEPYKDYTTLFIAGVASLIGIVVVILLSGCSIERKVAKTYRNAEIYNPISKEDSLHLLRASKKVIPIVKPKVIPPKTVRVNVPVKTYVLDEERYNQILDSLGIEAAENINELVDDCIKSVNDAKKEGIRIGLKEGYQQRNNELKRDSFKINIPAEPIPPDLETIAELKDCQLSLSIYRDSALVYRSQLEIKNKEAKTRLWIIILLAVSLSGTWLWKLFKKVNPVNNLK